MSDWEDDHPAETNQEEVVAWDDDGGARGRSGNTHGGRDGKGYRGRRENNEGVDLIIPNSFDEYAVKAFIEKLNIGVYSSLCKTRKVRDFLMAALQHHVETMWANRKRIEQEERKNKAQAFQNANKLSDQIIADINQLLLADNVNLIGNSADRMDHNLSEVGDDNEMADRLQNLLEGLMNTGSSPSQHKHRENVTFVVPRPPTPTSSPRKTTMTPRPLKNPNLNMEDHNGIPNLFKTAFESYQAGGIVKKNLKHCQSTVKTSSICEPASHAARFISKHSMNLGEPLRLKRLCSISNMKEELQLPTLLPSSAYYQREYISDLPTFLGHYCCNFEVFEWDLQRDIDCPSFFANETKSGTQISFIDNPREEQQERNVVAWSRSLDLLDGENNNPDTPVQHLTPLTISNDGPALQYTATNRNISFDGEATTLLLGEIVPLPNAVDITPSPEEQSPSVLLGGSRQATSTFRPQLPAIWEEADAGSLIIAERQTLQASDPVATTPQTSHLKVRTGTNIKLCTPPRDWSTIFRPRTGHLIYSGLCDPNMKSKRKAKSKMPKKVLVIKENPNSRHVVDVEFLASMMRGSFGEGALSKVSKYLNESNTEVSKTTRANPLTDETGFAVVANRDTQQPTNEQSSSQLNYLDTRAIVTSVEILNGPAVNGSLDAVPPYIGTLCSMTPNVKPPVDIEFVNCYPDLEQEEELQATCMLPKDQTMTLLFNTSQLSESPKAIQDDHYEKSLRDFELATENSDMIRVMIDHQKQLCDKHGYIIKSTADEVGLYQRYNSLASNNSYDPQLIINLELEKLRVLHSVVDTLIRSPCFDLRSATYIQSRAQKACALDLLLEMVGAGIIVVCSNGNVFSLR